MQLRPPYKVSPSPRGTVSAYSHNPIAGPNPGGGVPTPNSGNVARVNALPGSPFRGTSVGGSIFGRIANAFRFNQQ